MPAASAVVCLCSSAACSTHQSITQRDAKWLPLTQTRKTTQDGKEKHLDNQIAVKWITHQYISISIDLILCFLFFQGTERDGQQGHTFAASSPCAEMLGDITVKANPSSVSARAC